MAKVKELWGDAPPAKIKPLSLDSIDQNKLWVHYDQEADSMVIYITGMPTRVVSIDFDDIYLKVNPATGDIVGFHIEAWERKFAPAHPDVQSAWDKMKLHPEHEPGWDQLLRMLALWLVFIVRSDHRNTPTPQLAW